MVALDGLAAAEEEVALAKPGDVAAGGLQSAILDPRLGVDEAVLKGRTIAWFREPNLFFGGCQAVERHHETREFSGGGDPRRGGAVVTV